MDMEKQLLAVRLMAKQYEERGYAVTLAPASSAIPFSLGSYIPTILAEHGDEHLIIDIKTAGARVNPDAYFQLNTQIEQHPGWRFLIATLPEGDLEEELSEPVQNLSEEAIRARLKSIDRLGDGPEMATLVVPPLWTAFIASLRLLLASEGIPANGYSDLSLLNKAYSEGLLSFEEYEVARHLMVMRNRTVHSLDILETPVRAQLREIIETVLSRLAPPVALSVSDQNRFYATRL